MVYKPTKIKEWQMRDDGDVKIYDAEKPERERRNDIKIADSYVKLKAKFVQMLSHLEWICEGHRGRNDFAKHRIDLSPADANTANPAPYQAGPKAREFEKTKLDKTLSEGLITPNQTKRAAPTVFTPKNDGSLRFCLHFRKANAGMKREVCPISRIDKCVDSLGECAIFSTLDENLG